MFGMATITLGIGPHSSLLFCLGPSACFVMKQSARNIRRGTVTKTGSSAIAEGPRDVYVS